MSVDPKAILDEAEGNPEVEELKASLNRAQRKLDKERARKEDLVQAVYRAASDGVAALQFPKVPKQKRDTRRKDEETAYISLSDWQLGKETESYSSDICEQRIEELAEKVVELTEIQRADHPVKKLKVCCLGDLIESELIFPGQAHRIDSSLFRQVTVDGPRILGNFLRKMLANFERVEVFGVPGNHGAIGGRSRKEMHPDSNSDRMLYTIMSQIMESEERIEFTVPEGPNGW